MQADAIESGMDIENVEVSLGKTVVKRHVASELGVIGVSHLYFLVHV